MPSSYFPLFPLSSMLIKVRCVVEILSEDRCLSVILLPFFSISSPPPLKKKQTEYGASLSPQCPIGSVPVVPPFPLSLGYVNIADLPRILFLVFQNSGDTIHRKRFFFVDSNFFFPPPLFSLTYEINLQSDRSFSCPQWQVEKCGTLYDSIPFLLLLFST